jgi:hypothetical protein
VPLTFFIRRIRFSLIVEDGNYRYRSLRHALADAADAPSLTSITFTSASRVAAPITIELVSV